MSGKWLWYPARYRFRPFLCLCGAVFAAWWFVIRNLDAAMPLRPLIWLFTGVVGVVLLQGATVGWFFQCGYRLHDGVLAQWDPVFRRLRKVTLTAVVSKGVFRAGIGYEEASHKGLVVTGRDGVSIAVSSVLPIWEDVVGAVKDAREDQLPLWKRIGLS